MIPRTPLRMLSTPSATSILCRRCARTISALELSGRFPQHNRNFTERPIAISQDTQPPRPTDLHSQFYSPPPPPPPKPKRSLRPYIYGTIFFFGGLMMGQYIRLVIVPPPLPLPGSKDDTRMVEFLTKTAENLPIVQSLTEDPAWTHNEAYEGFTDDVKPHRLTTGPLGGARALGGFQRVFYNADTGECIIVVFIGGAVAGWPGVTHGGLIATIMDEALGRVAIRQLPDQTGVTANLELNYMKPIVTNSFYVMRSVPWKERSTDRKQFVSGRLETLDGNVCVEAKGLFVVPKKFKTMPV